MKPTNDQAKGLEKIYVKEYKCACVDDRIHVFIKYLQAIDYGMLIEYSLHNLKFLNLDIPTGHEK